MFPIGMVFKRNVIISKFITLPTALLSQVGALENATTLIGRMSNDPGLSTRGSLADICLSVCALEHGLQAEWCTAKESSCYICLLVCTHSINSKLYFESLGNIVTD